MWSSGTLSARRATRAEVVAWTLLLVVALALRLWHLGHRPLQFDEGQEAYFSWRFLQTGQFHYIPLLHGPLTYQLEAFFLWVAGTSDAVVRLMPALLGTAMVALPLALRRQLGSI